MARYYGADFKERLKAKMNAESKRKIAEHVAQVRSTWGSRSAGFTGSDGTARSTSVFLARTTKLLPTLGETGEFLEKVVTAMKSEVYSSQPLH